MVVGAQVFEAEDLIHRRGGFGIVQMSSHAEAEAAIAALDGSDAPGGAITVRWASPHEVAKAQGSRPFGTMNKIENEQDYDGNDDKDGYGEEDAPLPSTLASGAPIQG